MLNKSEQVRVISFNSKNPEKGFGVRHLSLKLQHRSKSDAANEKLNRSMWLALGSPARNNWLPVTHPLTEHDYRSWMCKIYAAASLLLPFPSSEQRRTPALYLSLFSLAQGGIHEFITCFPLWCKWIQSLLPICCYMANILFLLSSV